MAVIHGVVVDCADPLKISEFWRETLGYEYRHKQDDWCSLRKPAEGSPFLSFQLVPEGKVVKNRVHLDIRPESGTLDEERGRIENLGATTLRFFDRGEFSHYIMADPEGNEFCVLSPEHARVA